MLMYDLIIVLRECLPDHQPRENKKRADISSKNQETHSKNSLFFLDFINLSTTKAVGQYNYTKNSLNNEKIGSGIKDEQTGITGTFLLVFFIIHSISELSL